MIIDCHGHYTTTPDAVSKYREKQKIQISKNPYFKGSKGKIIIREDEIIESIENNQLKLQKERGIDLTIFSPRASWMEHHIGNEHTSRFWTEQQNELIKQVCELYPNNFVPVAQLPQSPNVDPKKSIPELVRCVEEMGFIGCNLNPDTSGGFWKDIPLTDKSFYPLYEKMVELDVPAMIHVSACCNNNFYTTGSYYLGADTAAFQQLVMSNVFKDFPELKIIIPHGGGAVPYHWGRFRGLMQNNNYEPLEESALKNIYFDTCVYHQEGINLLLNTIPIDNILFASEMIGAVRGIDPKTGYYYDDTKRYIDNNKISKINKYKIFEGNAKKVFSRLKNYLPI